MPSTPLRNWRPMSAVHHVFRSIDRNSCVRRKSPGHQFRLRTVASEVQLSRAVQTEVRHNVEYSALLIPFVVTAWAAVAIATSAVITVAISTLVPLLVLAAGFEAAVALHTTSSGSAATSVVLAALHSRRHQPASVSRRAQRAVDLEHFQVLAGVSDAAKSARDGPMVL
jgi:hypothetical protein